MAALTTEISLALPNRPGQLAAVGTALGQASVSIQSVSASTAGRDATVRLLFAAKDTAKAKRALTKAGFRIRKSDVRKIVTVSVTNKAGSLGRVAGRLAKAGLNVDSAYIAGQSKKRSTVALGVGKNAAKAKRALS